MGHRRIFFLLSFCALAILLLQAFWIRNFYHQVKTNFENNVYAGLEKIVARLQERQQLKVLQERQMDFAPGRMSLPAGTPRGKEIDSVVLVTEEPGKSKAMIRKQVRSSRSVSLQQQSFVFASGDGLRHTLNVNSATSENGLLRTNFTYRTGQGADSVSDKELRTLLDKMLLEVKIMNGDEKHPDTLRAVIKRVLANRGIFDPFEFSLQRHIKGKKEVISQSKGYDTTAFAFKGDLSAGRVFSTHTYLLLQFPGHQRILLSSMKGNLLLSLLFLGILLAVFYYTVRLIHKQKKLSDIKNDFVNNMTHELKTPIATISLAVDAMNHPLVRNNDSKYKEYTRILKEENARLNGHVERVLQLALIEKGELPLVKAQADLVTLTKEAVTGFALQAASKHIRVIQQLPTEPIVVHGDAGHLRSAIANLVDNAIKYSAECTEIRICLEKHDHEARLSVRDQGKGISREEQQKIFEKFYRVPQSAVHDVKGFGLGLSYVKSIVKAHGGTIEVVSEPGRGATFNIHMPLKP